MMVLSLVNSPSMMVIYSECKGGSPTMILSLVNSVSDGNIPSITLIYSECKGEPPSITLTE